MSDLAALQQVLGITFNELSLLEQSLVHSSYLNENPDSALTSNERLEFLGDAVLGLIVTEKIHQDFPHFNEGEMTRIRAAVVRRDSLARMATAINLGRYLYMGKGEEASGGRNRPANLAGALEAVIAAIFLDRGLAATRDFVIGMVDAELQEVIHQGAAVDYKSRLQELTQAREQQAPTYHVVGKNGPDHDMTFTIEARLGDAVLGRGSGKSKKEAETEAARAALELF